MLLRAFLVLVVLCCNCAVASESTGLELEVSRWLCWGGCGSSRPSPTRRPTTRKPTANPTNKPTSFPTKIPTMDPTAYPTKVPTTDPTKDPETTTSLVVGSTSTTSATKVPTIVPTNVPTTYPTKFPSTTNAPSKNPTKTSAPTAFPTLRPTGSSSIVVESSLVLSGFPAAYSLDAAGRSAFKKAVASALGDNVAEEDVEIVDAAARSSNSLRIRRLQGTIVSVNYRVSIGDDNSSTREEAARVLDLMAQIGGSDAGASPVQNNFVETFVYHAGSAVPATLQLQVAVEVAPAVRKGSTEIEAHDVQHHDDISSAPVPITLKEQLAHDMGDHQDHQHLHSDSKQTDVHGALMYLGWGILIPGGIVVARFGKSRPNAWWFKVHRSSQTVGLLLAIIGMVLGCMSVADHHGAHFQKIAHMPNKTAALHFVFGLITMVLGVLQPLNAILRPKPAGKGKGDKRTTSRMMWEVWHKGSGYLAVLLAFLTIYSGMELRGSSDAVKIFHLLVVAAWCLVFAGLSWSKCAAVVPATKATNADHPQVYAAGEVAEALDAATPIKKKNSTPLSC